MIRCLFIAVLAVSLPCFGFGIEDRFGHMVERVALDFGSHFADEAVVIAKPVQLRVKGITEPQSIIGEISGCTIGTKPLAQKNLKVLINSHPEITLDRDQTDLVISVTIENPSNLTGALSCAFAHIRGTSSSEPLVSFAFSDIHILAVPDWQDSVGTVITGITFSFAGLIAGPTPNANVDSLPQTIKLVNALAYPATVAVTRPTGCTIGGGSVANTAVHFMSNGTAVTTDTNISIASAADQTFALRFDASGGYAGLSGAVTCAQAGNLTYTY